MNIKGYDSIHDVLKRGTQALSPGAFETVANDTGALILDTRDADIFSKGFIPNSINIGIDGTFAPWVGTMIPDVKQEILLVIEPGREEEVVTRLARVGYDYAIGYLKGGFDAWKAAGKEIDSIQRINAEEMVQLMQKEPRTVLVDVRRKSEYDSEHIYNVKNAPLDYINDSMLKIDKYRTTYVHCAGGYRSMIFASVLRARGYDRIIDVRGGFKALKETGKLQLTDFVAPTTML